MKVKLFYIHPTNYGNLMMACVFIKYFSGLYKERTGREPEYYLDVLDDAELERVRKALPEGIKLFRENLFNRKRRGVTGKIEKLVNIPREIRYNTKYYDVCVVLGGDCISQYYSTQVFISDMVRFKAMSKKMPVYLLGQTMGPFSGYAVNLVKKCLSKCEIYVRDHDCYKYLENDYFTGNLHEARDLAFLDIPYQEDLMIKKRLMDQYIGANQYITVVASGADRQYTSNIDDYINEYIKIIKYIIDEKNLDVLLLAHVIHVSDSNDKKIIDKIISQIEPKYLEKMHVVGTLLYPYEARILIGGGLATITGRMHAAVSSINMGTIPICLSYSVKFKGVIGDDFDLNSYIYQCRGDNIWADGSVHKTIIDMLNQVLEDRENILYKIGLKLKGIQDLSCKQIIELADNMCR